MQSLYTKASNKLKPEVRAILKGVRMMAEEKIDLPANIKLLDKGGMTFLKQEMLGYLSLVSITVHIHNLMCTGVYYFVW